MEYLGDLLEDATLDHMWNTNSGVGASITRTVDGSIRIYKDNLTAEKLTANGITDSEDFDGLTGVHHLRIDTSNDTGDADFWQPGHEYFIVLVAATIDGQTVNACLAQFSIENRNNEVDAVKISGDSTAADNLEADYDGTGYAKTNSTVGTATAVTGDVGITQAGADKVWSSTTRTITGLTTAAILSIWNQLTSALTTAGSIGKLLVDNINATISSRSTVTTSQVEVATGVVLVTYDPPTKAELDAALAGLNNLSAAEVNAEVDAALVDYDAPTKAELDAGLAGLNDLSAAEVNAEVDTALADIHLDHLLAVNTDAPLPGTAGSILHDLLQDDSGVWRFIANALEQGPGGTMLRTGTAQAGTAGSITLDAGASAEDDYYNNAVCALVGGTGAGQSEIIEDYDGTTKVATPAVNWAVAPDATTEFRLLPFGAVPGASAPTVSQIADGVLDELRAGHDVAGSLGETILNLQAHVANKMVANKADGSTQMYGDDQETLRVTRTLTKLDDDTVALVTS